MKNRTINRLIVILTTFVVAGQCRTMMPTGLDEITRQRATRVHRVSNDEPTTVSIDDTGSFVATNLGDAELTVHTTPDKKNVQQLDELKPLIASQARKLDSLLSKFIGDESENRNSLMQLKFILRLLSGEDSVEAKDSGVKVNRIVDPIKSESFANVAAKSSRGPKDLVGSSEELDIYYQDGKEDERHVITSRKNNAPATVSPSTDKVLDNERSKGGKSGAEYFDEMLLDVQSRLGRIRKYFDKLCRKHHSTPSTSSPAEQGRARSA